MRINLKRILPGKDHFIGIDIGARSIKAIQVKVGAGSPVVVGLREYPSPKGVWADGFDEEALVSALKAVAFPRCKEVITCLGGENLISRVARLPRLNERELSAAVRFEIQKFVPLPVEQLIIRQVPLDHNSTVSSAVPAAGQEVLLLAARAATVYRYYAIFARAGLAVRALDYKAFALWRLFGRGTEGVLALVDIGANSAQLVLVREGVIKYSRLLPVGTELAPEGIAGGLRGGLTGNNPAGQDVAATLDEGRDPGVGEWPDEAVSWDTLADITRELGRTLGYYHKENIKAEKLILSGGAAGLEGFAAYLRENLAIPVEAPVPDLAFAEGLAYDPRFAVAAGLALREVFQ